MIDIRFLTEKNGKLVGFDITGHALFAQQGQDIICAAVSSAAFLVANTISEIMQIPVEAFVLPAGKMFLKVSQPNIKSVQEILSGLKLHFLGLEGQYPENINVNYTEV